MPISCSPAPSLKSAAGIVRPSPATANKHFATRFCANSKAMSECPAVGQSLLRRSPGAGGKLQPLRHIIRLLGERERVIDAQRPEHRIPDQTAADRGAERMRIGDLL